MARITYPAHATIFSAVKEVASAGGAVVEYSNGPKHSFIIVRKGNTFRKLTLRHGSKNLRHELDWAKQNTRRALRDMAASGMEARQGGDVKQAPSRSDDSSQGGKK